MARNFGVNATEYTSDRTPLLPRQVRTQPEAPAERRRRWSGISWSNARTTEGALSTAYNKKIVYYDHNQLLTWTTFSLFPNSVFVQKPVVKTFCCCIALATGIAVATYFIPSASKIDTTRFQSLTKFLTVFISFMLGIYVQQAFKHWWCSVTTFEKMLSSIRQLVYMLHQIKFDEHFIEDVEKLCLASTYILNFEIKHSSAVMKAAGRPSHDEATALEIKQLDERENRHLDWLCRHHYLNEREVDVLKDISSTSGVMARTRAVWGFIGELLAHVTELTSRTLPPPVETRMISLCQSCIAQIEELKMNIVMQTPFMYAHLLAFLVHVNNFILAASCGISIGSAVNETVLRSKQLLDSSLHDHSVSGHNHNNDDTAFEFLKRHTPTNGSSENSSSVGNLYAAIQVTWIQIIMVCLTPVLHVAFLHIAHLLCYPFGDEDYHLPMEVFIAKLDTELDQMKQFREPFRRSILKQKGRHPDPEEPLETITEQDLESTNPQAFRN